MRKHEIINKEVALANRDQMWESLIFYLHMQAIPVTNEGRAYANNQIRLIPGETVFSRIWINCTEASEVILTIIS